MRTLKIKTLLLAALILAGLSFQSCEKDNIDGTKSTTGILKIQLTDAPFPTDLVAEANVTINKIEIRKTNTEDSSNVDDTADAESSNPFVILKEEAMSFNLLELTNGVTAELANLLIDTGSYDLIRLYVLDAGVKLKDGTEYDLKVPSGAKTGIKVFINPGIEITGKDTAELLLDFDVSKSFVVRGSIDSPKGANGFIFKPVIKASNLSATGSISGTVSDTSGVEIDGVQVSIMLNDSLYTSSFTDEAGEYTLLGIAAGEYDILFETEGYESVTTEDVKITTGVVVIQNAELIESNDQ